MGELFVCDGTTGDGGICQFDPQLPRDIASIADVSRPIHEAAAWLHSEANRVEHALLRGEAVMVNGALWCITKQPHQE